MYFSKRIIKYISIFFIWLTPTFLLADPWQIDQDENFITLKKNGEIQHGNNIHFNFDKDNLLSATTIGESPFLLFIN